MTDRPFDPFAAELTDADIPLPTPTDDDSLGPIQISSNVVASIVKIASLEVPGVLSVGGTYLDQITGFFNKKEAAVGVRVETNDRDEYLVGVRVVLEYGLELARVAVDIQTNVKAKVEQMTSKTVAAVGVTIEEVRLRPSGSKPRPTTPSESPEPDPWSAGHED